MKILARLPNWLGDLVMCTPALALVRKRHPQAVLDVVIKQGLEELAPLLPGVGHAHTFRPGLHRGLRGLYRFARRELVPGHYDLYLSFPDSFSTALLGVLAGIPARRGYRGDLRSLLLTDAAPRPRGLHRVEEYAALVEGGSGANDLPPVRLRPTDGSLPEPYVRRSTARRVILNIQSEAPSRRLSIELGATVARHLLVAAEVEIVLTGTAKERERSHHLAEAIAAPEWVRDWAGETSLATLVRIVADADLVITTDSGLAHLANAVGTPEIVFFGAGDPANTAPYNRDGRVILRDDGLPCVPCVSNRCEPYDRPRCLEGFRAEEVVATALQLMDPA